MNLSEVLIAAEEETQIRCAKAEFSFDFRLLFV